LVQRLSPAEFASRLGTPFLEPLAKGSIVQQLLESRRERVALVGDDESRPAFD
jgi:hypothetical protein